ncbi:transporter substrate-binding domain-containing protein [Legionella shakespearei]|uniref:Amino acid ABC transporter substrate-binding protein n=1 Tax=Legionella shakespearei DSM 23087 TaxID=1122169 RepID=A0A0W0Z3D4_9GAMM|nr:transporter substrate-binding domain-containing protein [Legionella shakespearei]KTD63315.1 amino acid ABC transporter substrate-binding protein [Legionella shakespearei DSM 23087]
MRKYFILVLLLIVPFCSFSRSILIGVSHYDPPFIVQQEKYRFDGFDISMMKYVCRKLSYECEFLSLDRSKLLDAVANGTVDLAVSNLIITKERLTKVNFSSPYLINTTHIIGLKKKVPGTFSIDLLRNKKIGITDSDYADQVKALNVEKPVVKIFSRDDDMVDAITNNQVDFALVDAYSANYWQINSGGIIQDFGCPVTLESTAAIAINPNNADIIDKLNWALLDYLNSKQFGDDYRKYLKPF